MGAARDRQIRQLERKALMCALDAAVALADPGCDEVRIRPLAADRDPERQWRADQSGYIESWIIGPLVSALRQTDLSGYDQTETPRAVAYLDLIDQLDADRCRREQE